MSPARVAMVVLLLLILAPLAPSTAEDSDQPCLQAVEDPAGDLFLPYNPLVDSKPADILFLSMEWTDEGARMTVELAGDPRNLDHFTYSYWVSFQDGGNSPGGNPPTWTWQGNNEYDEIHTMYWSEPDTLPVEWEGSTFSFLVPWEAFEAQYGAGWDFDIGSPRISTAGPNAYTLPFIPTNPGQDEAVYSFDLVPLEPCVK